MYVTKVKRLLIIIGVSLLCYPLEGKDFGIQGELFPIWEENLAQFFKRTLAQKFSSGVFRQLLDDLESNAKHPAPIALLESKVRRPYLFDPSYTVKESIRDLKGSVLIPQGTIINPLKKVQLSSGLLFLDGDNPAHILWARKQAGEFKWILIQGDPYELESQEKRPIYFDQKGALTSKLSLKAVPARVIQEGERLKIEEIPITDEGDEKWDG